MGKYIRLKASTFHSPALINESFTFQQIHKFIREMNILEKKLLFYQKRKKLFTFPYYETQIKPSGFSSR